MTRLRALTLAVVLAGASPLVAALGAAAQTPTTEPQRVVVLTIEGPIDRVLERYLLEGIAQAEDEGAAVVIQIDSPGTLDLDAVALAERIHGASVPVVVWVGPTPAVASGAAFLLLEAAALGAIAPGAAAGPALPVDVARPTEGPDADGVRALIEDWRAARGGAATATLPEAPLPAQAAIDADIVAVAAPSVTDLLTAIDSMTVQTAAGPWTFRTAVATSETETPVRIRFTSPGPADRVLHASATPSSIYLLLIAGLAALAFELTQPGFGFAGFSGLGLIGLGVWGLTAVPASPLGLALFAVGVTGMIGDVVIRRLGVLTIVGLALFLAGSIVMFGGVADAIRISPWLIGGATIASGLYYGFVLTVAQQSRDRITSTQQGLIGLRGEARTDLAPEGSVTVKGTAWRAQAIDGPITKGTRVRVRGLDGLVLRVQAEPESGDGADADGDTDGDDA